VNALGLFHKAISQSGVATNPWAFTEREPPSMNKGFELAKKLGKATTDAKVAYEFLKKVDAKKLIQTEQQDLLTAEVGFFEILQLLLYGCDINYRYTNSSLDFVQCFHSIYRNVKNLFWRSRLVWIANLRIHSFQNR